MMNKIGAILYIGFFSFRIRNKFRNMSSKSYHRQTDETVTYISHLKLTVRAWLYIMGLTDAVKSRDKVYYARNRCSSELERCGFEGSPVSQRNYRTSDEKNNKMFYRHHTRSNVIKPTGQLKGTIKITVYVVPIC